MNLSLNDNSSLFASFSASSKATSWPTSPSMSYEAALKSAKKNTEIVSKFSFGHSQRLRFAAGVAGAEAGHVQEHGRCTQLRRCGCWRSPKLNFETISVYIKNQTIIVER